MSKSKDGGASSAVLSYLNKQNRPYSAVDIFNNLHKDHGKTAVQKALDQLVEEKKIKEKTYGKQKVYVADQSQFPAVSEEELKGMDSQILTQTQKLKTVNDHIKTLETELSSLNSSLTTSEIKEQIAETGGEVEKLKEKLENLSKTGKKISPEVREKVMKDNEKCVKEWRKRKRITMDIVNSILEGYPKGKKALVEEIGIETDEDVHVKMPEK